MDYIKLHEFTDCKSRISDEFFLRHIRLIGKVHLGLPEMDMELQEGGVIAYQNNQLADINRRVQEQLTFSPCYIYILMQRANELERGLRSQVNLITKGIMDNCFDAKRIQRFADDIVHYIALRVNHSVDMELFRRCLNEIADSSEELANSLFCDLQIPTRFTYYSFYHLILYATCIKWRNGNPNSLKHFKFTAGFLNTRTIHPASIEKEEELELFCANMAKEYSLFQLQSMIDTILSEHQIALIRNSAAMDYVIANAYKSKLILPEQLISLCHVVNHSVTFEELKHYWRIKYFQMMRISCEAVGLDIMTASTEDICKLLEKDNTGGRHGNYPSI